MGETMAVTTAGIMAAITAATNPAHPHDQGRRGDDRRPFCIFQQEVEMKNHQIQGRSECMACRHQFAGALQGSADIGYGINGVRLHKREPSGYPDMCGVCGRSPQNSAQVYGIFRL
jgi:hypothetical protein